MKETIIEVAPEAIARTLVVKVIDIDGHWEAHQDGRLFASWPDEISARVQMLQFVLNGFRVIEPEILEDNTVPSPEAIAASPFRMGYRVAIAHEYKASNPETFSTYRFPDGTMLKDYIGIAA